MMFQFYFDAVSTCEIIQSLMSNATVIMEWKYRAKC